ncbi:excalibur calcium-binding domain-containing protein [Microlunatus parietis]|uniref:Putative membrane protein n=1 Tax=Microlunatus parietis TaxID=682979 RepID=A0A7Y9I7M4_9ACTN|nr:excalibur calcium-binding domain-containing protein [Microlunatus parietis]NYE71784.1 putative membrane protein [Microlunatus parietis]
MRIKRALIGLAAASALLAGTTVLPADAAPKPKSYKNCAALNKVYPHGVAKKGAKDKVKGKSKPVKNFTVSSKVYSYNDGKPKKYKGERDLDRDNDGVACEKR